MTSINQIHFDPMLPQSWLIVLACMAVLLLAASAWKNRNSILLRLVCMAALLLALFNPALLQKEREATTDVAVLLIDESASQKMGDRAAKTETARAHIESTLTGEADLELRTITASGPFAGETEIFDALERTLADVPAQRRAGVMILSDGQIHDIPQPTADYGPVHLLLSGSKREKDRRIEILEAPSYGIAGERVSITYRVRDTDNIRARTALVTLDTFDGAPEEFIVPIDEEQILDLDLAHAGENIFELRVEEVPNEITLANNRAAIKVNAVRDRLKVLLVSGKPHAGGRTWRDLLTSDPGVDLVHFTILREPSKLDSTPQNELALIAFPFRELFEVKLYDFDLIIFDRYRLNRILPQHYFKNIASYVKKGGALLEASGPSFASEDSIYYTDLGTILPARPDGNVVSNAFQPRISEAGQTHPVTERLYTGDEPGWGSWLRQVALFEPQGDVLMEGANDLPLLILNREGEGRVAQIASDHIWLWSRGYEGGGPHAELLRRTVHWLMKEPELDERALDITVNDQDIRIRSRDAGADTLPLTMTRPDGAQENIMLERDETGFLQTTITAGQLGIYAFSDGEQKRFAIVGENNPPELRDVLSTPEKLAPLMQASGGGALWLEDTPTPRVRMISNGTRFAGRNWIGLRDNHDFTVKSVRSNPLLPPWAWLLSLTGLLVLTWWREGRRGR